MSAPKTEEELAKSRWWWKRTRFLFPRNSIDPNPFEYREWKDGLEQTAFEYELVRRVCKTRELPPFVELGCWFQENLHHRFCPPRKKLTLVMSAVSVWHTPPGEKPTRIDQGELVPHGLGEANADDFRWNLEATNNQLLEAYRIEKYRAETKALKEAFIRASEDAKRTGKFDSTKIREILDGKQNTMPSKAQFLADINRQRVAQGITPPRRLQGQRNRRVSWRWVELLDIAEFKIKRKFKDTETERQTKKRARDMAKRLLPNYLEALEEFENSPRRPKEKVRPKPLLAREV